MADRVVGAYLRTGAARKARLIDFETGHPELRIEHQHWLDTVLTFISQTTSFYFDIVGYASKIGDESKNQKLSGRRAAEVTKYLQDRNKLVYPRVRHFEGRGTAGYTGAVAANDDSADMRAVEVHVYIGDVEPPPPPNVDPKPHPLPPLPGAARTAQWSVAAPGGATGMIFPGVTIGFNVFFVRHEPTKEIRGYIVPAGGLGYSYSGPSKGIIKQILSGLLGAPSYGNMDYEAVKAKIPFNWEELEGSLVTVSSIGGGVVKGAQAAHVTFDSTVAHYGQSEVPIRTAERLFDFNSVGKDWQFGVGASALAGPLVRVDN